MTVNLTQSQYSAIDQEHQQRTGDEPCHDCECDCRKTKGRWVRIPRVTPQSVEYKGIGDLQGTYYFDTIPKGVTIHIELTAIARIAGEIECRCPDKEQCKTAREWHVDVPVPVKVPISYNALQAALRAVPYVGWAITIADLAYKGYKIARFLWDNQDLIIAAYEPARRIVEESSDLICEGRFDRNALSRHVQDIGRSVNLDMF